MRWDNNGGLFEAGETRSNSATFVDFFPTLIELCGITNGGENNVMPADREIDGVSFVPVIKNDSVVHTEEHPILHMKREDIKAIQYTVPSQTIKDMYPDYDYAVLDNEYITLKYFDKAPNDNSAFFDKSRKNWLHILTDDYQENYNRTVVYPEVSAKMNEELKGIQNAFKDNRRGIIE